MPEDITHPVALERSALAGVPVGQTDQAGVDRDGRLPAEIIPGRARIEPVRSAELLGEEAGQRRLGRSATHAPHLLDERPGERRDSARHLAWLDVHTGGGADAEHELADRARLTVGDDVGTSVADGVGPGRVLLLAKVGGS